MSSIGIRLPTEEHGYDVDDMVEAAVLADDLGYHSVWVPELQGRDAFMCLGQIASETESVRLGTGIVCVYARTPAMLAMSAATLDQISDGRAVVGIGASSRETVEAWHGQPYSRPLRHLRETIEIVKATFEDGRVSYDGELFELTDYPPMFDTVQETIPIYNAALGETNRRLTAEFADGWLPVHVPFSELSEQVDAIRTLAADAGRDPAELTVAPYVLTCVSEDADVAHQRVSELLGFYIGAMDYYASVFTDMGHGSLVESVREAYRDGGRELAAEQVRGTDLLEDAAIAGTPDEARERLYRYHDCGVDVPIIYPPPASRDVIESTIEELAPQTD